MAEVTVPRVEKITALSYGGESTVVVNEEMQEYAKELRRIAQEKGGEETFRARLQRREGGATFSTRESEILKSRSGGGAAGVNEEGKAFIRQDAQPEQRASYEENASLIERNSRVLNYLEILAEPSERQQEKFEALQKEGRVSTDDFSKLKEAALDNIVTELQTWFPMLGDPAMEQKNKRILVEDTIARDPKLRAKIAQKMAEARDFALKLPEVKGTDSLKQAEERKKAAEQTLQQNIREIAELLRDKGITTLNEATIGAILKSRANSSDAQIEIFRQILGIGPEEMQTTLTLLELPTQIAQAEDTLQKRFGTMTTAQIRLRPGGKDALDQIDQLKQRLVTMSGNPALGQHLRNFNTVIVPILTQGKTAENQAGVFEGGISSAYTARTTIGRAEREIAQIKSQSPDRERLNQQLTRLAEEGKLTNALESVLSDSIAEVLDERVVEIRSLEQKKQEQLMEDKAKENKEGVVAVMRNIDRAMRTNWVNYDEITRTKTIRALNIGNDVRFLAYYGRDEGLKRLFVRHSGFTDENGRTLDWKHINLETDLNADQKEQLDEAIKAQGETFISKLFADFFTSRGITDRTLGLKIFGKYALSYEGTLGDMTLKEHEWVLLEKNFGPSIDSALEQSREAKQVFTKLQKEGIAKTFKLKWLLWLLLILGVVGIGGGMLASKGTGSLG